MSFASLDQPAPQYAPPGPDQRLPTMAEAVDTVLMVAGKDGILDGTEQREIQRMMSGLQAIAEQKAAMAQQDQGNPMSDETEPFGAADGTETADNEGPIPGQQDAPQGY